MCNLFFSIIIPVYNAETTISKCLQSVLQQSYADFEILIIDGLSNDRTIQIIKSIDDRRIKIFSQKDSGIYDAMNKGIYWSQGQWLYFLGSDDQIYNTSTLETLFNVLKATTSSIVYGNVLIAGSPAWAKNNQVYDGIFNFGKIVKMNICHQAIFYKKEVFFKLGNYSLDYKICSDYDFNLRCFANYKFHYINQIIATFSGNGKSSYATDEKFNFDFVLNVLKYFKWQIFFKKEYESFLGNIQNVLKSEFHGYNFKNKLYVLFSYYLLRFKIRLSK